jgi:uncharacterized protein (DUF302 family)
MKNSMVFLIIGIIIGAILAALLIFRMSPQIILKESQSKYNFEETMLRFTNEVQAGGWKITATHDLQATLLKNGKEDVNSVSIVEICNPNLAEKILKSDDEKIVSTMMPCRVSIYERADGKVYVSRMNSGFLAKAMGKVAKKEMATAYKETEGFLESVLK